jgi:DNA mismatch repair protein MutS2
VVKAIRAARAEILKDPDLSLPPEEDEAPAAPLVVGTRVRWRALGIAGEILALHGDDEAELAVSGKRVRVPRSELVVLAGTPPSRGSTVVAAADTSSRGTVPAEINLIGLTVDEALPRVDKLLDNAALSERREIRVIHGFGAGRLKRAVAGLLDGHPHVASWRLGRSNEGGGGATIVELKD